MSKRKLFLIVTGTILVMIAALACVVYLQFMKAQVVTQGNPIGNYKNPGTALIIIDVQNAMTDHKSPAVLNIHQTDQIINNINKIIDNAKDIKLSVIYITNEFKKGTLANLIFLKSLEEGSQSAKMDSRIKIVSSNHFVKDIGDSFSNHQFEQYLIKNEISNLIITGLDAQYCVDRTIRGALNRKYNITVISDAIATKTEKKRNAKLKEFDTFGLKIISTDEFIKNK